MTKKTRNRFLYILSVLFIISAPILIFYSMGYTFDFSKIQIEKTGGAFLKSKIHVLSVFLDSQFIQETSIFTSGTILTNLKPGIHLLRLEKAGFHPWFKTVDVKPMEVEELRNIILIPEPPPITTPTKEEILTLMTQPSPPIEWHLDKKENLIKETPSAQKIIASNVNSFGILQNTVYWIDKNGFLARLNSDNQQIETIGRPGFYLNKKPVSFIFSPKGEIYLIDPSGGLFMVESENKITPLSGEVIEIRFDTLGDKILILKERSIDVWRAEEDTYQPFRKKGAHETVISLSTNIQDARWFYGDNAHIVIRTKEGIFLTELDGRGGRNTTELVSGKTDELITTPEIPTAIFFRKDKKWKKIEL